MVIASHRDARERGAGGAFVSFQDGEDIILLQEDIFDDHGPMRSEYYFRKGGELFFIYEYSEMQEMQVNGSSHVTEDRYYLHDGKCLQHLNKRKKFNHGEKIDMSTVRNEEVQIDDVERGEELRAEADDALERFEASKNQD